MRLQQEVDSILDQVEAVQKQKEEKKQEKEAKSGEKETSGSGQGGKNSGDGKNSGSPAKGGFSKGSGFQKGGFRDKKVFVKSAKMDLDESGLIYGPHLTMSRLNCQPLLVRWEKLHFEEKSLALIQEKSAMKRPLSCMQ